MSGQGLEEPTEQGNAQTEQEACTAQPSKPSKNHKGRRQMDDTFMCYQYKIKLCTRTTPHNWKLCPWAHPGETAAIRRHPSCHMAEMCPAVRQHQECPHGEACLYSRNTFECWLHPFRYRTTMCSSGEACTRNICFFAHNEQELRHAPESSEQWLLPAAQVQPGNSRLPVDGTLGHQQLVSSGGVLVMAPVASSSAPLLGPLVGVGAAAGEALGGRHALSPVNNNSCPLPCGSGASWCAGPSCSAPGLTAPTQAQQLQMQALMQQQQQQQPVLVSHTQMQGQQGYVLPASTALADGGNGALYGTMAQGLLPVLGASVSQAPVLSGGDSPAVLCPLSAPQTVMLTGQHKQLSPARNTFKIAATAGMFAAGGSMPQASSLTPGSGLVPLTGTATLGEAPSQLSLGNLQPHPYDRLGMSVLNLQQQQRAAVQQAAMLRQLSASSRLPVSSQLSAESLSSSLMLGSSNSTIPQMSLLTLSDLSTDSLVGLRPQGYALTQELGSNSVLSQSACSPAQDFQLLPLDTSGLIQLSGLDETVGVSDQHKQLLDMATQQTGHFW